jgi:rhodanese-related sulfurtransferase
MDRFVTTTILLATLLLGAVPAAANPAVTGTKRTVLGKYLSAQETYGVVRAERDKLLFVDVRTGAELVLVGATPEIDVQVPFSEFAEPRTWDAKAGRMAMTPNPEFVADIEAALARKGLGKASKVLIICRSGERSARAVDVLAKSGFTDAWSVYDGFEGDLSSEGHRTVNGWKNAKLPWSFKIDGAKLSPRSAQPR